MQAKFAQGSIFKHINVMTFSGAVGLLSLFLSDLLDVYFLNLLGEIEITAAVGFAGSVLFFTISMGIGLSIGCGARVSQVIGSGDKEATGRIIKHAFIAILALTTPIGILLYALAPWIMTLLGADGDTLNYAVQYIRIVVITFPLLSLAMASGGVIRALGAARSSMFLTMIGAIVNAILDPIFIFVLDGGIQGAAWATVLSRVAMFAFGFSIVKFQYGLLGSFVKQKFKADLKKFFNIALPAMLTNLATPIATAYITAMMASFGDAAVAGSTMVSRLQSVAFAGLFALSGAIGPIAGQNFGAQQYDRIFETLNKSVQFTFIYCAVACSALYFATPLALQAFDAEGVAADIVRWFCYGFSLMFLFNGITFVSNALLNNLNAAHVATGFNFGKATIGTMPFVYFGAQLAGPYGIYWGTLIGAAITALAGYWYTLRHVKTLEINKATPDE